MIARFAGEIDLFAPDTAFLEIKEHLPALCAKRGLPTQEVMAVYESVSRIVQELPEPVYREHEAEARARVERRDPDDWPVIACEAIFGGVFVKGLDGQIQQRAREKLKYVDAASDLRDLAVPPPNQLEALKGDRRGQYSIRISKQWRVCFKWKDGDAFDVEIVDYH